MPGKALIEIRQNSNVLKGSSAVLRKATGFLLGDFTDELQPLDRTVFGTMKAMSRHLFEETLRESSDRGSGKLEALQILPRIWDELSLASIRKGWSIYDDFGRDGDAPDTAWEP
jgi:hypothetical protein